MKQPLSNLGDPQDPAALDMKRFTSEDIYVAVQRKYSNRLPRLTAMILPNYFCSAHPKQFPLFRWKACYLTGCLICLSVSDL